MHRKFAIFAEQIMHELFANLLNGRNYMSYSDMKGVPKNGQERLALTLLNILTSP